MGFRVVFANARILELDLFPAANIVGWTGGAIPLQADSPLGVRDLLSGSIQSRSHFVCAGYACSMPSHPRSRVGIARGGRFLLFPSTQPQGGS